MSEQSPTSRADLDTLIESARLRAASARSDEAAASAALRVLADNGGSLPVQELIRRGVQRDTLAALVDESTGTDKRKRVRARLTIVRPGTGSEVPMVHLTAVGWSATGRPSGKEVVPSADTVEHAMAPFRLSEWFDLRTESQKLVGVATTVSWGPSCRRFSDEVVARAWARLRTSNDQSGALGSLTGGLIPDALVVESWSSAEGFQNAWGHPPANNDELAESVTAIEYEHSAKADDPLRSKVDRWSAATEQLAACAAVVWVVRSASVADRLVALGVGDSSRRPFQYLVPAAALGLPTINNFQGRGATWWPLRLAS